MPSMGVALAKLVARTWRAQQCLAKALAAARAVRAERQRQVARAERLRREWVALRQQGRDTLWQSRQVRAGAASGRPRGREALAARLPGANPLTLDLTYRLLAARGLLTPAEARGAMTPPPAPGVPGAPKPAASAPGEPPGSARRPEALASPGGCRTRMR